jgi:hypothetical protein
VSDLHVQRNAVAVLGLLHCPLVEDLSAAHSEFQRTVRWERGRRVRGGDWGWEVVWGAGTVAATRLKSWWLALNHALGGGLDVDVSRWCVWLWGGTWLAIGVGQNWLECCF